MPTRRRSQHKNFYEVQDEIANLDFVEDLFLRGFGVVSGIDDGENAAFWVSGLDPGDSGP